MERLGGKVVALDELCRASDYLVVCCVLNDATRSLVSDACFAAMKQTAYLVNVARGPIVDEPALIRALKAGQIAGAGLDVTTREPIEPDNPLLAMDNVIITPHALCWTDECFHDIAATALDVHRRCRGGTRAGARRQSGGAGGKAVALARDARITARGSDPAAALTVTAHRASPHLQLWSNAARAAAEPVRENRVLAA